MVRHFLRDDDLSPQELVEVLDLADAIDERHHAMNACAKSNDAL